MGQILVDDADDADGAPFLLYMVKRNLTTVFFALCPPNPQQEAPQRS